MSDSNQRKHPAPEWSGGISWTGAPSSWGNLAVAFRPSLPPSPPPTGAPSPTEPSADQGKLSAPVRFLHVVEQGAVIRKTGSRVRVQKEKQVLLDIPAMKLQGVLVFGNIQVTTQCMRKLTDSGVWLSFFSRSGQYKGRIQPPAERGGRIRLLQWRRFADDAFKLGFARAVVRGKIRTQSAVARAFAKNYLADAFSSSYQSLGQMLDKADQAESIEQLRGIEGAASRAYFEMFRRWNRSEWEFPGRHGRGAKDPINSLLNFGYALATRELEGLLEAAGLDPVIGFYHVPDGDRPSLACDWVEEFRHSLVDRLVLKLINTRVIQSSHFEEREKGGLRLVPDALRKYLAAYEKAVAGPNGFRARFVSQLGRLLDTLDSGEAYVPWSEEPDGNESCFT